MALGFLNIPYKSTVLSYDDESTPIELSGSKMLPILKKENNIINESLDIILELDVQGKLKTSVFLNEKDEREKVENLLFQVGSIVHPLAMPYWIFTPEFNDNSRKYFSK